MEKVNTPKEQQRLVKPVETEKIKRVLKAAAGRDHHPPDI